jgi:hypothetical protein
VTKLFVANKNKVYIELSCGKIFNVTTDDGTALEMALRIVDWSDKFAREDRAQEITNPGVNDMLTELCNLKS